MNATIARRRLRRRRERRSSKVGRWLLAAVLALAALGVIGAAIGVGTVFAVYQNYADDYVPIETLLQQRDIALTEIYDRKGPEEGTLLGKLSNPSAQLLDPVPLEEISDAMIWATISTEDNDFFEHPGISYTGILRAAYDNYVGGGIGAGTGGSTITQQLIKNVYICPSVGTGLGGTVEECIAPRTVDRKLREITYALELEKDYPKEDILEWYLNQISYADRYIGVQAAAEGYFHKNASELTLAEAAMLAGIPQAPTAYHPRLNCIQDDDGKCILDEEGRATVGGAAKERQEAVLDLMVEHGRATRAEVEAAKAEPLLVFERRNTIQAEAWIDNQVEPALVRMCNAGVLPLVEGAETCEESVHSAGYQVTTTIDWEETQVAQEMIRGFIASGLAEGCECYNAAIVTIEPTTGQIIIYAPNRDPSYTSDERVSGDIDQLVEINQPGSSFKPVVYLTWFDRLGKAPLNFFWDTSPLEVEGTSITNPRLGEIKTEGLISARAGLGGSQNVPAFRAATEAGVDNVIEMAKRMGITTLEQHFDPTWRSHPDVTYGASIATGGANIRAVDMAYMNSVIANMGVMVGLPHHAEYFDMDELKSKALDEGEDYELAKQQQLAFQRGHIRLPGTRELDPIVILEVRDIDGEVIYTSPEPERVQVVDAGSVWLLHSIMSDCRARFVIWGCGNGNDDPRLDAYDLDGVKIPMGVKTGTQQGPLSAVDTLEVWMNGYTRYAATAVWVGNANNDLVLDGPGVDFAAAHTVLWLFKHWMGEYHDYLKRQGLVDTYLGFSDLQPSNVALVDFKTPATDRIYATDGEPAGGCDQVIQGWARTDVEYDSGCEEVEIDVRNGLLAGPETPSQFRELREFVALPEFKPEGVEALLENLPEWAYIPVAPEDVSTGESALEILSPQTGDTIGSDTFVRVSVNLDRLKGWKLEIGPGSSPLEEEWQLLAEGEENVSRSDIALINIEELGEDGIYTIRLTADSAATRGLTARVLINLKRGFEEPTPGAPTPGPGTPYVPPPFPGPSTPTPSTVIPPPPAATQTPQP